MKFRLFSDLHLEFGGFDIPPMEGDDDTILLLAGDVAVGKKKYTYLDFLDDATSQFSKVIYIPGNHEYYHGSRKVTWERMKENMAERLDDPEFHQYLHMVNMETVDLGDVAVVCATMWTNMDDQNPNTLMKAGMYMNDYNHIRRGNDQNDYAGKLQPMDTVREFTQAKFFIFEECRRLKAEGKKVLVMTHHGPSRMSIHPRYDREELNGCYVTELAYDIMDLGDQGLAPDVWVHGHIHDSMDYMIGDCTRVLVNPRGYVDYQDKAGPQNRKFDPTFTFEL